MSEIFRNKLLVGTELNGRVVAEELGVTVAESLRNAIVSLYGEKTYARIIKNENNGAFWVAEEESLKFFEKGGDRLLLAIKAESLKKAIA